MKKVTIEFPKNFFHWSQYVVPVYGFVVNADTLDQAIQEFSKIYNIGCEENIKYGKYWNLYFGDSDLDGSLVDIHIENEEGIWFCPKHDRSVIIPLGHKLKFGRLAC